MRLRRLLQAGAVAHYVCFGSSLGGFHNCLLAWAFTSARSVD